MVIKGSTSAEVARLIDRLLSSDPIAREAAAARLAIVGSRAVDRLIETLDGLRRPDQVVALLDVLERIADPRAADAAARRLDAAEPEVASAAAGVVRLALGSDDADTAARATDALLRVATDDTRPAGVRTAATAALNALPAEILETVRARLPGLEPTAVGLAAPAADSTPQATSSQPLDEVSFLAWIESGTPELAAATVRDAIGHLGSTLPLPALHRCVDRARALESGAPSEVARLEWRTARGAAHHALAERDSRVALYDLRETVERTPDAVTVSMLGALQSLGDASCLEAVASGWERAENAWVRPQLRQAFDAIVRREALTRRHAVIRRLAAKHPALVDDVFSTLSRTTPSRSPSRRT